MQQIEAWPELPWSEWASTGDALHRWSQLAGKVKLALTPVGQSLVERDLERHAVWLVNRPDPLRFR